MKILIMLMTVIFCSIASAGERSEIYVGEDCAARVICRGGREIFCEPNIMAAGAKAYSTKCTRRFGSNVRASVTCEVRNASDEVLVSEQQECR